MTKYLLSIDQGTTSSKAILFDMRGRVVKIAQQELKRFFPQDGYVEQNPQEILDTVLSTIKEVLEYCDTDEVISCGITNQRETIILWDKESGKPVYNAIVWQDRRTDSWIKNHQKEYREIIKDKTGLLLDAYFSASKIKWILDNVPEAKNLQNKKRLLCGTIDSFLLWHLTGRKCHKTDSSNACRTMLYNIHQNCYDEELLKIFDIPRKILPEVKNSVDDFGYIDKSITNHNIPIRSILGDQQAATVGQSCIGPSMGKITFGTGCFMMLNTGQEAINSTSDLLTTILYSIDGKVTYALEGACFYAGAVINWLKDSLNIISDINQTEEYAKQAKDIKGLYFVPAFGGLGAPYWNPEAKALIKGITNQVGKKEIVKAAFDSIVLQALDLMNAMEQDGKKFSTVRIDGGMANNKWFTQHLANYLKKTVEIPENIESTSFGAALFAAYGAGHIEFDEIPKLCRIKGQKEAEDLPDYQEKIIGWKKAVNLT